MRVWNSLNFVWNYWSCCSKLLMWDWYFKSFLSYFWSCSIKFCCTCSFEAFWINTSSYALTISQHCSNLRLNSSFFAVKSLIESSMQLLSLWMSSAVGKLIAFYSRRKNSSTSTFFFISSFVSLICSWSFFWVYAISCCLMITPSNFSFISFKSFFLSFSTVNSFIFLFID